MPSEARGVKFVQNLYANRFYQLACLALDVAVKLFIVGAVLTLFLRNITLPEQIHALVAAAVLLGFFVGATLTLVGTGSAVWGALQSYFRSR